MSPSQQPPADRRAVDVICLGRLAVDLYAQQLGARLEDVASMAKYLGGSSANIAFGCSRLGLRAAMASRVGDDHMGRFLKETLAAEGCDVSHVSVDPDRLSALVLLGIRDRETFPLVFYRQNCADMAVRDEDVEEPFIASSRAFLVTGTHLSTEHVHQVSSLALQRARRHGVATLRQIKHGLDNREYESPDQCHIEHGRGARETGEKILNAMGSGHVPDPKCGRMCASMWKRSPGSFAARVVGAKKVARVNCGDCSRI